MSIFNTYMETDQFLIRNIKVSDKSFIMHHFQNEIMCTSLSHVSNDKAFHDFLEWSNSKKELALHNKWIIVMKKNDRPIGTVGFNHISRENKTADIEYELARIYWSKGYIYEIMDKLLLFGFKKLMLNRLFISFTKSNVSMNQNLLKIGFKPKSYEFKEKDIDTLYGDHFNLEITVEDYQKYLNSRAQRKRQYFPKATIIFPTLDMERTRDFYVEHLGFTSLFYYSDNSRHIHLQKDEVEIALVDTKADEIIPNRKLHKVDFMYDVMLFVSDIDMLYKELKNNHVKIIAERQVTSYSNKEFAIEDCDGRWIGIGMIM